MNILVNLSAIKGYYKSMFFLLDIISLIILFLDTNEYDHLVYLYSQNKGRSVFNFMKFLQILRLVRITRASIVIVEISRDSGLRENANELDKIAVLERLKIQNVLRLTISIVLIAIIYPLIDWNYWNAYDLYNIRDKAEIMTQTLVDFPDLQDKLIIENNKFLKDFKREIIYFKVRDFYEYGRENLSSVNNYGYLYVDQIFVINGEN